MNTSNKPTFAMNDCGIQVKKCCASCQHKCLTALQRTCSLHGDKEVEQNHVCPDWGMVPCLKNLGKVSGEVKKKSYLQFVMMRRWTEDKNIELGFMEEEDRQTVEELREEFVGRVGSVYIN